VLAVLFSAPAAAYEITPDAKPRWPFDLITYYVGQVASGNPDGSSRIEPATRAQTRAVARAMRSWTRAGVGWYLRRVDSAAPAEADVLFALNPRSRIPRCLALGPRAFGISQAFVGIRGRCGSGRLLSLIAAHELGHVLGLGDESNECAAMNQRYIRTPAGVQPAQCTGAESRPGSIIRTDDRRGARRLYRRPNSMPSRLCDPSGELPIFATNATCRYSFDCRGQAGDQLIDRNGDGVTDALATEDKMIELCRRRLLVRPLPDPRTDRARRPTQPPGSGGAYTGVTSAGTRISFGVGRGFIRTLRLGAVYECSDGTRFANRPDPLRLLATNHEELGPFPPIPLEPRGFRSTFETPNETAVYELEGRFSGDSWTGSLRALEGWGEVDRSRVAPDPDGLFICDTGQITFTAERRAG
jgi:hypothetical protein